MQEKIYNVCDKMGNIIYENKTRADLLILLGRNIQIGNRYQDGCVKQKYVLEVSRMTERSNTISDALLADFELACRPFRKIDREKPGSITLIHKENEERNRHETAKRE